MTLLPSDVFGITGHPGNPYNVNEICCVPGCAKWSAHTHHCWPRSYLRKDYEWVRLPMGEVIGNRVGMCVEHHEQVTGQIGGYKTRLTWDGGILWWEERERRNSPYFDNVWERVAPIDPQPPLGDMEAARKHDNHHEGLADGDTCPTCGHHKKKTATEAREKPKAEKPRKTKEWTLTVPDDAEVGATLLDEWVEDVAIAMGAEEWSPRQKRYHALAVVRAWWYLNRTEFVADLAEAADRRVSNAD